MQVTVENLSSVKKRIEVELPADQVRHEFERAYQGLQRKVKLKGFRPGRVPRPVLERHFGEQIKGEVAATLIARSYQQVLKENSLDTVGDPEITTDGASSEAGLRFTATVEVKPEVRVNDYLGLTVARVEPVADPQSVEQQLERLREMHAQMVAIEDRDSVEDGDLVVIDYRGIVGGRELEGASASDRVVEVGAGSLPADFEKQLVGMRCGETRRIEVDSQGGQPSSTARAQKIVFRVELKQIGRKELPTLDDEFAKDCGDVSSLEELREKIQSEVTVQAERTAQRTMREKLIDELVEKNPVEIPDGLVERRLQGLLREIGVATSSGDRAGDHASAQLLELQSKLRPQAVRDVRSALLLEEVAKREEIDVSDQEVRERVDLLARVGGSRGAGVEKLYRDEAAREQMRSHMRQEKALDKIVAKANIIEVEKS